MGDKKRELENTKEEARLREQVVKLKEFGKEIEEIQKSRITPDIYSIQDRIMMNCMALMEIAKKISNEPNYDNKIGLIVTNKAIQPQLNIYKSIRMDICETLKKKDKTIKDKFDKLFPEITYSRDTKSEIIELCCVFTEQLMDIYIYLNRYVN